MLGSTEEGAKIAAHFGLPFSFAHFISPHLLERAAEVYRAEFTGSPEVSEPVMNVGVFVLCADTEEEADDLAICRDLWRYRVEREAAASDHWRQGASCRAVVRTGFECRGG